MSTISNFSFKVYENTKDRYGLKISDGNGKVLREYRDICDDGKRLRNFAERCSSADIAEEHLDNIVEDFIYKFE